MKPEELTLVLADVSYTLSKMVSAEESGRSLKRSKFTGRGLVEGVSFSPQLDQIFEDEKSFMTLVGETLCYKRKKVIDAVLQQQEEHTGLGIVDPNCLRTCSCSFSQFAVEKAMRQAEQDFQDTVEAWQEDDECSKVLRRMLSQVKKPRRTRRNSSFADTLRKSDIKQVRDSFQSMDSVLDF